MGSNLTGCIFNFFKIYQTFRACNFFQHILANSGFSLWHSTHFKELSELSLTTCSRLLIFHFYCIKMEKNGQFLKIFHYFQCLGHHVTYCNTFIWQKPLFKYENFNFSKFGIWFFQGGPSYCARLYQLLFYNAIFLMKKLDKCK